MRPHRSPFPPRRLAAPLALALVAATSLAASPTSGEGAPAGLDLDAARRDAVGSLALDGGHALAAATWSAVVDGPTIDVHAAAGAATLSLTPRTLGRDGWELALEPGPTRGAPRAIRRRVAPGVTERLDARAQGVELSYRFEARPPGVGDLVVRLDVDTALVAPTGTFGAEGLRFEGPSGDLVVGGVLGVDARGRQVGGELVHDGATLALVLPGAFVDDAAYPLLLDPVILPTGPMSSWATDSEPDFAHNAANDSYGVLWERAFSPTSRMVMLRRVTVDGAPFGPSRVVGGGSQPTKPSLACCNATGRYVFAYRDDAPGLKTVVVGSLRATDGAFDAGQNLEYTASAEVTGLDVGGGQLNVALLVVATDDGDVLSQVVKAEPTGQLLWGGGPPLHTGSTFFGFGHDPEVSKSGGPQGNWAVVWEAEGRGLDPEFVRLAVLDANGAPIHGPIDQQFDPAWAYRDVSCDSDGDDFVLAWVRDSSSPDEVWAERLTQIGSGFFSTGMQLLETTGALGSIEGTSIAHARTGIAVAWRDRGGTIDKVRITSLDPSTFVSCEPKVTLQAGALSAPKLCASASAGPIAAGGETGVAWWGLPLGAPGAGLQRAVWQACP